MSSAAKRLSKKVPHTVHKFQNIEMYNTLLGSFLISLYILKTTDKTPQELSKVYKSEKKRWLKGNVSEETWMQDLVDKLNTKRVKKEDGTYETIHTNTTKIPYGQIACIMSPFNMLIAPYVNDQVLPLREDGWKGLTLETGEVHVIIETPKTKGEVDGVEYEVKDE